MDVLGKGMDVVGAGLNLATRVPVLPGQLPAGVLAAAAALPGRSANTGASSLGLNPQLLADNSAPGRGASKIEEVANSFESLFWSLLTKEMRQTLENGGLFGQDKGDIYGGLFDLYVGQHLAPAHALGIAAMIRQQLDTRASDEHHAPTTAPDVRAQPVDSLPGSP
jgi:Rod binding domain-containing protein